jgi:trigger factor
MDTLELPGIDDTFVQSLGFANVDAFNTKLRENIGNEKTLREREKNRIAIIEDIVREARIPLPNILIEHELAEMEQQFSRDLAQGGTTLEKYLAQTNKSREDLHKEWYAGAEKRAKMHLVLREIAQKENISAPKEDVDKYVDQVLAQHKKADPDAVRTYYELNLRNEAVFRFLERV